MPESARRISPSRRDVPSSGLARAVVTSIAALVMGSVALVAAPAASAASTASCGGPVVGSARVIVVVDDGAGAISTHCIVVPRGTNGSQMLRQRAAQLGTAVPSHAGSGLLCTIDSFPGSGCSETASGSYWANFSGTGGDWSYSSYNPFIRRVCDGDIEGWRYVVRGSGGAGDVAPRVSPGALALSDSSGCDEPLSVAPAPSGGVPGPSDASGVTDVAGTAPDRTAGSASAVGGTEAAPPTGGRAAQASPGGRSTTGSGAAGEVAADVAPQQFPVSESASTSWIGLAAAVALIAGLGLAALLRSRRVT